MKILFLLYRSLQDPSVRFRVLQYLPYLEAAGIEYDLLPLVSEKFREIIYLPGHKIEKGFYLLRALQKRIADSFKSKAADIIYIQRELFPLGPAFLEPLYAKNNPKIIYDFDDAIFLPAPGGSKFLRYPEKIGQICGLAQEVIVGNKYLANYAQKFNPQINIIPTPVDTDYFVANKEETSQDIPVIGWIGSHSTVNFLVNLLPLLKSISLLRPFVLKIVGKDKVGYPGLEIEAKAWNKTTEVEDIQSFDLGLMPMPENEWSLGKCAYKALQYMAGGVPVIAQKIGMNNEVIEDGYDGLLASNDEEWKEKILLLLSDRNMRKRLGRRGREKVIDKYSLKKWGPQWLSVINKLRSK